MRIKAGVHHQEAANDGRTDQSSDLENIGEVAPDADLKHLDPAVKFRDQFFFDSVDFLTFVTRLQKELDLHIPEQDCPQLATLHGCVTCLKDKIESKGGLYDQSDRHS